jgi:hypothetical protein
LLAQEKHNMARAKPIENIFRSSEDFIRVIDVQKKREKPGVSWQFSLYTTEIIPYDANEPPPEKPTKRKLYMGKIRYFKGETWQS